MDKESLNQKEKKENNKEQKDHSDWTIPQKVEFKKEDFKENHKSNLICGFLLHIFS